MAGDRGPLWAPWRSEYVGAGPPRGCIFCESDPPVPDRERLVVWRGPTTFVLLNRYPYAPGHLMIAPYVHESRILGLPPECQAELVRMVGESVRILEKRYGCDGLNVGANLGRAAGAGFAEHLHVHVVPRWAGDTNFMTAVGELRVIPKHLEKVYDELVPAFAELPA